MEGFSMSKKGLKRVATFSLEGEGFSIHTFELTYQYTERSWMYLKDKLYRELEKRDPSEKAWIYAENKERDRYICTRYSGKGVRIILEHNTGRNGHETYYVRMVVNPRKLLDPDASYLGILKPEKDVGQKICKAFRKLFKGTPFDSDMEIYYLSRLDLCTNVRCDNSKIFRELIRASQKLPTPAKFERKHYHDTNKDRECRYNKHYICFACGSYELVMYDKTYQITEEGLALSYEKLPKGVLRYEMRMKRNLIRGFENRLRTNVNVELLNYFINNADVLLCDVFLDHFSPTTYMREPELMEYIWRGPYQDYVRYGMQHLVENVVRFGSVDKALAKTKWDKAEQKAYLKRFKELGLSPIPLRKNFSAMQMPNPSLILYRLYLEKPVSVEYIRSK